MTESLGWIGARGAHDTLLRVLSQSSPCKVLDVPAGTGALARFLRERGWEVACADIDPGLFRLEGVPLERVNLNRDRLPYADESFDAVICSNGLHRLFNVWHAIREFARVLRKGGSLHVNVNNYASIQKRLRFLIYGSISNKINEEASMRQTIDDPEALLRFPLTYPQLANAIDGTGLRIVEIRGSGARLSHRLLSPLAWGIRLCTCFIGRRSAQRNRIRETRSSAILPGGRYVYLRAVKNGPS